MLSPAILQNISLKPYNTFHIDARCRYFATFETIQGALALLELPHIKEKFMILGAGSNLLFCKDYEGAILKNAIKEFQVEVQGSDVFVTLGAGNSWHESVTRVVEQNYYGIENLALIPGTAGAAPAQNIGAYGVEIKDVLHAVNGYHLENKKFTTLSNEQCQFGYRDSIFKHGLKNKFIITSIVLKLSTLPKLNISYGALKSFFSDKNEDKNPRLTARDVYDAVCAIRRQKLPDPNKIGNAGSFFKNPTIKLSHYQQLKQHYGDMPSYTVSDSMVKIPAAYLIEQAGFKGLTRKIDGAEYGVHKDQPLVIVNFNKASGEMIYQLALEIQQKIKQLFDIILETEVNIIR